MDVHACNLTQYLHHVMGKFVKINENEKTRSIAAVKKVLGKLLQTMKDISPLFKEISGNLYWTGSMYDELRVKDAREFDVNIILKMPPGIQLYPNTYPGFTMVQMPEDCSNQDLLKRCDSNNYILPGKVREWMQSVVHLALNRLILRDVPLEEKYSTNGPAVTIEVTASSDEYEGEEYNIDVDIVPVLQFSSDQWPQSVRPEVMEYKNFFFAVPKTEKYLDDNRLWRLGLSQSERIVLKNKGAVKMVIRLIKCMRNHRVNLAPLCSYHIKVAVMWMLEKHDECQLRHLAPVFILALKTIRDFALKGNLPNYWYPLHNLWNGKDHDTLSNIGGQLSRIINKIQVNPLNVLLYYYKELPMYIPESIPPPVSPDDPEEIQQQLTEQEEQEARHLVLTNRQQPDDVWARSMTTGSTQWRGHQVQPEINTQEERGRGVGFAGMLACVGAGLLLYSIRGSRQQDD